MELHTMFLSIICQIHQEKYQRTKKITNEITYGFFVDGITNEIKQVKIKILVLFPSVILLPMNSSKDSFFDEVFSSVSPLVKFMLTY